MQKLSNPREWGLSSSSTGTAEIITRGKLPHWYVPGAPHFVTYRLAGTIPQSVLREFRLELARELNRKPPPGMSRDLWRKQVHKRMFLAYDDYLDSNRQIDWLIRPGAASIIRSNLYFHNGDKYHLMAYSIMPNHVHVLFQPTIVSNPSGFEIETAVIDNDFGEREDRLGPLAKIMHSLKSFTANKLNKVLGRSGQLWQHESYDHWVRDDDELERVVDYISANPVKAGLVENAYDWFFCSSHDRYLFDGARCGYLQAM